MNNWWCRNRWNKDISALFPFCPPNVCSKVFYTSDVNWYIYYHKLLWFRPPERRFYYQFLKRVTCILHYKEPAWKFCLAIGCSFLEFSKDSHLKSDPRTDWHVKICKLPIRAFPKHLHVCLCIWYHQPIPYPEELMLFPWWHPRKCANTFC